VTQISLKSNSKKELEITSTELENYSIFTSAGGKASTAAQLTNSWMSHPTLDKDF
jgi:hypothetical protein